MSLLSSHPAPLAHAWWQRFDAVSAALNGDANVVTLDELDIASVVTVSEMRLMLAELEAAGYGSARLVYNAYESVWPPELHTDNERNYVVRLDCEERA